MSDLLVQEPLYIKLKNRLTDYIQKEKPRLLPCEKDLMKHYGVSRNTVRRVVFELTKDKILKPVQGLGTLVYPQPEISDNSIILVI